MLVDIGLHWGVKNKQRIDLIKLIFRGGNFNYI